MTRDAHQEAVNFAQDIAQLDSWVTPKSTPSLEEVFPHDEDIPEPLTRSNITRLKGKPEAEESLADLLTAILNRLDILESHFTPAGLDILSETLERRLVARLRRQGSTNLLR